MKPSRRRLQDMKKNIENDTLDPYRALANAIILQAVKELRTAYRLLARNGTDASRKYRATELENFFYSPWYRILTTVDGDMVVRFLRQEAGLDGEESR